MGLCPLFSTKFDFLRPNPRWPALVKLNKLFKINALACITTYRFLYMYKTVYVYVHVYALAAHAKSNFFRKQPEPWV